MGSKRIAIACQGGGTHAAFTWGVLTTILKTKQLWDAHPQDGETLRPLRNGPGLVFRLLGAGLAGEARATFADFRLIH